MALLNPEGVAVASVRVKGFCEAYQITIRAYDRLLQQYPDFRVYIEAVARLRLKHTAAEADADGPAADANVVPSLGELFSVLNPNASRLIRRGSVSETQTAQAATKSNQRTTARRGTVATTKSAVNLLTRVTDRSAKRSRTTGQDRCRCQDPPAIV